MSFIFRLRGGEEMSRYILDFPEALQPILRARMQQLASTISERIKEKLSGEVLQVRSGALRASIFSRFYYSKSNVTLSIGSRGDISYAAIQEYGGEVELPLITPKNKLAILVDGKPRAYARAHAVKLPARSYLRSTISEMEPDVAAGIVEALQQTSAELRGPA